MWVVQGEEEHKLGQTRPQDCCSEGYPMRISSPGTHFFPGNSLFQLFLFFSPVSSHSRKKRRHFFGGDKNYYPRVVHVLHTLHETQEYDLFRPVASHFHVVCYFTLFYLIQSVVAVAVSSYRITEILSKMKYGNQGIFLSRLWVWSTNVSAKKNGLTQARPPAPIWTSSGKNQAFFFCLKKLVDHPKRGCWKKWSTLIKYSPISIRT